MDPLRNWHRRIDRVLQRLPASQPEAALLERAVVNRSEASGKLALDILMARNAQRYLEQAERLVDRQGYVLGPIIGAGAESMVFDVAPRGGGPMRVLKLGADPFREGPYRYPHIDGVFPYEVSEQAGPYRLGVQMKVTPGPVAPADELLWRDRMSRVFDVVDSQGYTWEDAAPRNMGTDTTGRMGVIDGWLRPTTPMPRTRALFSTPEQRIRALLMGTP